MSWNPVDEFFTPETTDEADYADSSGSSRVDVIFVNPNTPVSVGDVQILDTAPQAICRASDLPTAQCGATLRVNDETYAVVEVSNDGMGLITLKLGKS
jgi:hypothetical protein